MVSQKKKSYQLKKGARHVGFARANKTKQNKYFFVFPCILYHKIIQTGQLPVNHKAKTWGGLGAIERPHTDP
jgi:hypothetical protein